MREVLVAWSDGRFSQDITVAGHRLRADEPLEKGGGDTGPAPHELLLAALGSCTAMTLKMYADRKGWALKDVHITLNAQTSEAGFEITRQLSLHGELDAEQRQRLIEIADKCPVHRTLLGDIIIRTAPAS
ncbi:MAG TPA: OsmC family protein [Vicinamibacterales bacterium]|nr:OsmC family protein [Vicinamibacterales bacterium]